MASPVDEKPDFNLGTSVWTAVLPLTERRRRLCRHAPGCPRCGEAFQVQLLFDALSIAARWRCRMCQFHFLYEPLVPVDALRCTCKQPFTHREIHCDG